LGYRASLQARQAASPSADALQFILPNPAQGDRIREHCHAVAIARFGTTYLIS